MHRRNEKIAMHDIICKDYNAKNIMHLTICRTQCIKCNEFQIEKEMDRIKCMEYNA